MLDNKLNITNAAELSRVEEKLSKLKAKNMFESGQLFKYEIGTFKGLSDIHRNLFEDIYEFVGKIRDINIVKDGFQFAPRMYLVQSLEYIDQLPHSNFDEIIEKYAEMNVAHPFREGNGRATRMWLDDMLRAQLGKVVDWNRVEKDEYLMAMIRSHVATGELKYLIQEALTDNLEKETFFKGIDASYLYEGYAEYLIEEIEI